MGKQKIMVSGANGQLGKELQSAIHAAPVFDFIFLSRQELRIEDPASVLALFEAHRPAYFINCAAYTAVDRAESETALAFQINGDAVGALAGRCKEFHTRLVHISTDYVFDGQSAIPLREQDPTGPVNVYGASKLRGEQLAMQQHAETVILRTSWVYSEFGNNFVRTMIRLMKEKESIGVIDDQIGSPTYAADLALAILHIIGGPAFIPGIFHYSNEGEISWYDFALAIKEHTHSTCQVNPITSAQYPTAAKRPHYSLLDKSLIRETYGIAIPDWKPRLEACLERIRAATY